MLSPKNQIRLILREALHKMDINLDIIIVEYPENKERGHYSSPVALGLARELKRTPRSIAEEIVSHLGEQEIFSKVEIAGAGFLNFFLSDLYLREKLNYILESEVYGQNSSLSTEHILLEYISANPTGPLHIGHGRWAAVGDSLARLLKISGADVFKEFYVNDAGVQIKHLRDSVEAWQKGLDVAEDGYRGSYVEELAKEVTITGKDPEFLMQAQQEEVLKKFSCEMDNWYSEKSLKEKGAIDETFAELRRKNAVYEHEEAIWFKSSEFSNDNKDRVVIKSDGNLSYFASDIAYHREKIKRGFPHLINILGFDHHGYVERISAAVKVLGGNLTVLLGQMVFLFRNGEPVRMSKRTGDIITLEEVIDEIGADATRYLLLRRPMNSSVDFDLEVAKTSTDENPVFYVQYAHARISSILRHTTTEAQFEQFQSEEEKELIREMIKFEDLILEISKTYDIHKLPTYLEDFANVFHRFYRLCRILEDPQEKTRLILCQASKKVLQQGLYIMGVSTPEKMERQ